MSSTSRYTCPRCGYSAPYRCSLILHLRRKTACQPLTSLPESDAVSDDDLSALLGELEAGQGRNSRTRTNGTTFSCTDCGRAFNFRASLSRHKKSCPSRLQVLQEREDPIIALQKRCEYLQEEMKHLRERPHIMTTTTNNYNDLSTVNNNNQNIAHVHVNALGREDLSGITPELVDTCIRRTTKGLVELMEKIHFDTTASNQNLRASLLSPEQVEYFDGGTWKYGPRNRVVRQVVDTSHLIMSERYDDNQQGLRSTMSRAMYEFVDRWMNKMTRSNAQVYVDVMSEVYCSILNRTRDVVTSTEIA